MNDQLQVIYSSATFHDKNKIKVDDFLFDCFLVTPVYLCTLWGFQPKYGIWLRDIQPLLEELDWEAIKKQKKNEMNGSGEKKLQFDVYQFFIQKKHQLKKRMFLARRH